MNGAITESSCFLKNSTKRQMFLERVIDKRTKLVRVKDLCRTRWIYRHEAYESFFDLFKYLHAVMEAITTRDTTYGSMDWDASTIVTATGLRKIYNSFGFIYAFIVTMHCMSVIKPISIKFQYKTNDLAYAYMKVQHVISDLKAMRSNDQLLHDWYEQAEALANDTGVSPEVPRTVGRQQGRENVEYDSAETYYRRMTALPLLDHLIQQMQERFGEHQIFVSELLTLVPSLLCEQSATSLNFDRLVDRYRGDLPQPALVGTEISKFIGQPKNKKKTIFSLPAQSTKILHLVCPVKVLQNSAIHPNTIAGRESKVTDKVWSSNVQCGSGEGEGRERSERARARREKIKNREHCVCVLLSINYLLCVSVCVS